MQTGWQITITNPLQDTAFPQKWWRSCRKVTARLLRDCRSPPCYFCFYSFVKKDLAPVQEIIQAPERLFSGRTNFSLHSRCKKIRETGMMQID
jgi:hypothetical protein